MNASDSLEERKGRAIELAGGTAKKHSTCVGAWLDVGKASTHKFCHIIVEAPDPEDPEQTCLDTFRALKTDCLQPDPTPQTCLEAAFQQVPQLGWRLTDFARMVAKCRIRPSRELSNKIKEHLDREIRNLMMKGPSAEYRLIDTSELPNVVEETEEMDGQ